MYLYGSHDLPSTCFPCEGDYQCWSASVDDLSHWRSEGTIYRRLQGPFIRRHQHGLRPFSKYLFAPDIVQVGAHWYLYYGVGMSGAGIGVAIADSPTGPFKFLGRVTYPDGTILGHGWPLFTVPLGISIFHKKGYPYDPAVIYTGGRLFLYFGYGHCYVAELSTADMRTIIKAPETGQFISPDLIPAKTAWRMQNAPSIRQIGKRFFLTYYAKKGTANALCYATSQRPFGPFSFRGVLVSLGDGGVFGNQAGTAYQGNTHGGLFRAGGHYYQSYHRQTGGRDPNRQACLVELCRTKDGLFKTAHFTSQVQASGSLPWAQTYMANTACILVDRHGRCRKHRAPYFVLQNNQQVVTNLRAESQVGFKYLDFTGASEKQQVTVELANSCVGEIKVLVDDEKRLVGTIKTTSGQRRFVGTTKIPAGRHAVYFVFNGLKRAKLVAFWFGPA